MAHRRPFTSPRSPFHRQNTKSSALHNRAFVRPALVTLHPNLRRLPSRVRLDDMTLDEPAQAGLKRKRAVGGNENAHAGGRPTRGAGTLKRRRSQKGPDEDTEMRLATEQEETESDAEDTDEFLIHEAPEWKLARLKKDQLVALHSQAGLESDDFEELTKADIIAAIIRFRAVSKRPSRSLRRQPSGTRPRIHQRRCISQSELDPPSSSSEEECDGNDGGDEETDTNKRRIPLRRRATEDEPAFSPRPLPGRSISLNQFTATRAVAKRPRLIADARTSILARKRSTQPPSGFSSPTESGSPVSHSPPDRNRSEARAKGKHVEFDEPVGAEGRNENALPLYRRGAFPSPRRLRSRADRSDNSSSYETKVRTTPARKAKRTGSLQEDPNSDELDNGDDDDDEWSGINDQESDDDQLGQDQLDEMIPSKCSPSSSKKQIKPTQRADRRLRPRRVQTYTPPSDGDDEGDSAAVEDSDNNVEELDDNSAEETCHGQLGSDIDIEPRRLRNGKIIVEDDYMDVEPEADSLLGTDEDEELDELDDKDAVDLASATAKSLVRLRRDDLVRLCETRDLDIDGTKPQLVKALLTWRDHRPSSQNSPSSGASTAVPSTPRRKPHKVPKSVTPVLMRSDRIHVSQPRTPPLSKLSTEASQIRRIKDIEPELEIDLEGLGLEDREIPPEKLVKLEKIGSGGFKDVYIGKLRGRKVAIAEFRGQLSQMDIKELKLLRDFDHPNVVRFLGVSIPENPRDTPVMMVSELCANGDLFDYLRNVPPPPLHKVINIMLDIAHGLEYLHLRKPSVIHRDCKSSNILITSKATAKIADFGLAKVKQSTRSMVRSLVGTVNWQAPELWHAHPKYDHKVDVFSCGLVFWEILQWHNPSKKYPWEGMNEHAIYEAVGTKKQRPPVHGLRKHWCREVVELVERMWAQEPRDRPTMSDVVQDLQQMMYS